MSAVSASAYRKPAFVRSFAAAALPLIKKTHKQVSDVMGYIVRAMALSSSIEVIAWQCIFIYL